MNAAYVVSGDLGSVTVGENWALVLGGVTRLGRRRAERALAALQPRELDVIWFDGTGLGPADVEGLNLDLPEAATLVVVDFTRALGTTFSARIRRGGVLRRHDVSRGFWRGVLRPLGGALQPRTCWRVIKRDMNQLERNSAPQVIVCCDDAAITSAWNASRRWPTSPVASTITDEAQ